MEDDRTQFSNFICIPVSHPTRVDRVELAWHSLSAWYIRLVSEPLPCCNTTMTAIFERALNTFKDLTGYNIIPNMRSNNDPLPSANKSHHGDQENQTRANQEGTTQDEQGSTHQVEEAVNAHVSEDLGTSSSSCDRTDLNLHKNPVQAHREPRKPNTASHGLSTKTRSQSRSPANEIENPKTRLGSKQSDLGWVFQQKELERKLEGEKEDLRRKNVEAVKQIRELQGKNQKLEEELKMLKGALRGVQEKQLHTARLLEERTADLKGAQTFLTTTDRYAGAEIMKMVEALNAEIFQGAALISELLEDETTILKVDEQTKDTKGIQDVKDWVAQHIGRELTEHLSTKSEQVQVDPLPLQLAIQAVLTSWCIFMVDSFCAGPARDDLMEIYRRIWESEPQAVAGRWRAMTVGQAKHLKSTTNKDAVINVLSILLRLCGSPITNLNSQKTSLCLQQVVSTIVDMWMQLRIAMHEGITTTDMQVFGANPNDIYQDAFMSNIYASAEDVRRTDLAGKEAERILCVVGMGLQRSVIKQNGDGTKSIQRDITLKSKVAFPSVLLESA